MSHTYAFTVRLDEQRYNEASLLLVEAMRGRVRMSFTPQQFEDFRLALIGDGIRLTEIERMSMYTYSFTIWPDEKSGFTQSTFGLFEMLKVRAELNLLEDEFESFKADLLNDGFILCEVERVPHHEPESVP